MKDFLTDTRTDFDVNVYHYAAQGDGLGPSAIKDRLAQFELMPPGVLNLGFSTDEHWFAARVVNESKVTDFVFTNQYAPLDYLDIFVFRDGILIDEARGGELQSLSASSYPTEISI